MDQEHINKFGWEKSLSYLKKKIKNILETMLKWETEILGYRLGLRKDLP